MTWYAAWVGQGWIGLGRTMNNRDRLRIVHCVRAPIGGIFRHIADLAAEQARAGHAVGLICDSLTGGPFDDKLIDRLRPHLDLGVERIPMRREIRISDLASSISAFNLFKGLRPDVLHGHGSKGGAYVRLMGTALRLFGNKPVRIYCPHGGSLHYDAATVKGRVIFAAERFLEKFTDELIFVSAYERNQYRAKVGQPRIPENVVYNGLTPAEFEPVTPSADRRDFLYIGMLRDIKGPDVFIRALAALRDRGIEATAHIVGDGPDRDAYHALVGVLGLNRQIAFHDPMPARAAFACARSVVVPSRGESMPYIVLEAIAAEMPIIATSVGGIPEIFGREADMLLPPDDVHALADAMQAHLAEPDTHQDKAAKRAGRISGQFSVATMAHSIERIYRSARVAGRNAHLKTNLFADNEKAQWKESDR